MFRKFSFLVAILLITSAAAPAFAQARPNVILMLTDDQGIGDFGVMGNSLIETPNVDTMAKASGSMSQFYVSPVCSPTRASLMTGRYNQRTRCIDTWLGRSMMDTEEYTLAEALKHSGYKTGIFGKWHLGDCYPMRPADQGFDEVLIHRGGGLAQPSEPLENDKRYTDAILFDKKGKPVKTKGFCTDVYFDAALEFISKNKKSPFFIYLPTNAPHGPYHDVPEDLRLHYMKKDLTQLMINRPNNEKRLETEQDKLARIAAMITNEDQNVGRLFEHLKSNQLMDNTLVIRINDNGPNSMRYVGDMRGMKTQVHEGGVRSPCWLHWPAKIPAGTSIDALAAHIDLMPTILEACGASASPYNKLDGRSFLGLFTKPDETEWPDKPLVIQSHRGNHAVKYHHFMIRDGDWKLLHASGFGLPKFEGEPKFELYNLKDDPGEKTNLVEQKPAIFAKLKSSYDEWFEDVSNTRPDNYAPPRILIGTPNENPTDLTRQDWRGESWRPAQKGHWLVMAVTDMKADIEVIYHPDVINGESATHDLKIGDEVQQMTSADQKVLFQGVTIPRGDQRIEVLRNEGGKETGAYQLVVKHLK